MKKIIFSKLSAFIIIFLLFFLLFFFLHLQDALENTKGIYTFVIAFVAILILTYSVSLSSYLKKKEKGEKEERHYIGIIFIAFFLSLILELLKISDYIVSKLFC